MTLSVQNDMAPASPTNTVLGFVEGWRARQLPSEVEERTRQVVLDTLACYLGGTRLEAGGLLLKFAERSFGDVTLFPLKARVSQEAVSFASSSIANLLDADDTLYNRGHHACAIVMPSLVIAGRAGVSLRSTLRAIAIGYEMAARLSLSWSYYTVTGDGTVRGAPVTGLSWIVPGLAVALGLIRGLDENALRSAFGIAAYGAPIPTNSNWHLIYPPETMTKYSLYGAMAQQTISAVELADLGFVGPTHVLDGPHGFRQLIGALNWDDDVLRDGIVGKWAICETALKRYPVCRIWHGALYGLEYLVRQHDVAEEDVRSVDVRLAILHPGQRRLAEERPPLTEISAQFSVPYGCAQVIRRREPGPDWYEPSALESTQTKELMRRIAVTADPALNREAAEEVRRVGHYGFKLPWSVAITLRSGSVLEMSGTNAPGDPFVPEFNTAESETEDKFRRFSRQLLSSQAQEKVIGLLHQEVSCSELLDALGEK